MDFVFDYWWVAVLEIIIISVSLRTFSVVLIVYLVAFFIFPVQTAVIGGVLSCICILYRVFMHFAENYAVEHAPVQDTSIQSGKIGYKITPKEFSGDSHGKASGGESEATDASKADASEADEEDSHDTDSEFRREAEMEAYVTCPYCGSTDTDGNHCYNCGGDF